MQSYNEILKKVTCNWMREITPERAEQAAKEYAEQAIDRYWVSYWREGKYYLRGFTNRKQAELFLEYLREIPNEGMRLQSNPYY